LLGIVSYFSYTKGYGFIKYKSKEIFTHFSNIVSNENFRKLEKGDKVKFKIKIHPKFKKEQAFEITVI